MNNNLKNKLSLLADKMANKIDNLLIDEIKFDYWWRIEVLVESGMTKRSAEQFYIDTQLDNYRNGYKKVDQDRDARIERDLKYNR